MKKVLFVLFSILYLAVGFVSTYHAIEFFSLSNATWLAVILAIAFEVGQAAVLFSLLTSKDKSKIMPWVLMIMLTLVQVLGNIFSAYHYLVVNNPDMIKYFTESILFFVQNPNPKFNQVMVSYITGAILPVVSLCMTSMVVNVMGVDEKPKRPYNKREPKIVLDE